MYTASLPPLYDGDGKSPSQAVSFGRDSLPSRSAKKFPWRKPPGLKPDFERSCTPENGCSLEGTGEGEAAQR